MIFVNWLKNYLSHIFSLIGIILTIYFSIFHVPDWIKEFRNERLKNVNEDLIKSVQEYLYNNQEFNAEDINSFIRAKEIRYELNYPYSLDELLIQAKERFMENNYLPLIQRKKLIDRIDSLRQNLPIEQKPEDVKISKIDITEIISVIISLIFILAAIFGIYSLFTKRRTEKEAEISEYINSAIDFENLVAKIIEDFGYKIYRGSLSAFDPDIIVDSPRGKIAIEVKYSHSKISKEVVHNVSGIAKSFGRQLILVTNVALSSDADQQKQIYEMISDYPIIHIVAPDKASLIEKIDKFFKEDI